MSTLPRKYAHGLYNVATAKNEKQSGKQSATAEAFIELLKRRGQLKMLASVLIEYKKIADAAKRRGRAVVRIADEKDGRELRREIECALEDLGVTEAERIIDERLTGGVRIETHGAIYDRTHRRALMELFHRIVSK